MGEILREFPQPHKNVVEFKFSTPLFSKNPTPDPLVFEINRNKGVKQLIRTQIIQIQKLKNKTEKDIGRLARHGLLS